MKPLDLCGRLSCGFSARCSRSRSGGAPGAPGGVGGPLGPSDSAGRGLQPELELLALGAEDLDVARCLFEGRERRGGVAAAGSEEEGARRRSGSVVVVAVVAFPRGRRRRRSRRRSRRRKRSRSKRSAGCFNNFASSRFGPRSGDLGVLRSRRSRVLRRGSPGVGALRPQSGLCGARGPRRVRGPRVCSCRGGLCGLCACFGGCLIAESERESRGGAGRRGAEGPELPLEGGFGRGGGGEKVGRLGG